MADRPRILVADDEELERRALRRILSDLDAEVVEAENGRLAVELAERLPIDLAFLDIRMPGMGGLEAARELRRHQPALRVVFLTAFDSFDFAREALRIGVDEYLVKPADPQDVRESALRALSLADSAKTAAEMGAATLGERARALQLLEAELARSFSRNDADTARLDPWLSLRGLSGAPRFVAALRAVSGLRPDSRTCGGLKDAGAASFIEAKRLAALTSGTLKDLGLAVVAAASELTEGLVLVFAVGPGAENPLEALLSVARRAERELSLRIRVAVSDRRPDERSPLFVAVTEALPLAPPGGLPLLIDGASWREVEQRQGDFVERAFAYLRSDLSKDSSLAETAEAVGCSPYHLSRLFTQRTGDTFTRAYARLKVDAAKVLLTSGKYSVKEVGALVGFRDQAYFARVFKRLEGLLPTDYRARSSTE